MGLDPRAARTDLTNREVAKIVSAVCGGLTQMAEVETVREAIRWVAETDAMWEEFTRVKRLMLGGLG